MKKVTMKRALSLALAAAMAASVCTTALAEEAVVSTESAPAASEAAQPEQEAPAEPDAVQAESEAQAESQPESEAEEAEESTPEQPAESGKPGNEPAEQEPAQEVEESADAETQEAQSNAESIAVQSDDAQEEAEQAAATVNGQEYDSLQAAIDAASEGTVTLQQDIHLEKPVTIAEGKNLTLDLNGHKVTAEKMSGFDNRYETFKVYGTLTLKDGVGTGIIEVGGIQQYNAGFYVFESGKLTIESGTVKVNTSNDAVYVKGGTLIVNGGYLYGDNCGINDYGNANIEIHGGTIMSTSTSDQWGNPVSMKNGTLTVTGGTFFDTLYAEKQTDITNWDGAKISISGGSFGKEPLPEQIAAGYEAVEKDGVWVVQKFEPVATVNGNGYKTLQEAFAAAKSNEVITLAKDTAENITVPAGVDYILNLNANTLTGTITIPEKGVLAVQGGSMAAASEEAVLFDNSGLLHIVDGNYSAKNLFKVSANAKIEVEHGYFGAKVDAKYLVEGTICKRIGNADQRYPYVVTLCAPSDVKTETEEPTSKVEENKELGEGAADAAKAAESIKVADSSVDTVKAAVEAKAKVNENTLQQAIKALEEKNPDVVASDIRIVTEPELTVKPTAMDKGKSITFEIGLNYTLKATDGTNTVELETQPITDLDKEIEISLGDVSAAGIKVGDTDTVYIKHVHDGKVSFYAANHMAVNGVLETVSFKTKGFSPFTLLVSPSVTVEANGTSVSLDPVMIGQNIADLLPYAEQEGCYVIGWTFTAGDKTLTTAEMQLNGTLLNDLIELAENGAISMTPVFAKNSSSSSSSSDSSYVAPDDSVYYTCVKCGYHDWTATADGYQCDHCGYKEVVKQIAGYEHVKGVYEPVSTQQAQQANTKALSVSTTASPKTGDNTNLALAVAALAISLAGVGALVFLRKKNH